LGKIVTGTRKQYMTEIPIDVKLVLPRSDGFTNFTVHTARCFRRADESITHMRSIKQIKHLPTRELQIARGHVMPPALHLSDI